MQKLAVALVATLIVLTGVLTGCASGDSPEAQLEERVSDHDEESAQSQDQGNRATRDGEKKKQRKPGGGSSGEASAGTQEDSTSSEDRDEGDPTSDGSGSSRAPYPAAGTYSYSQSGFEEFCDTAGNCDKEKLPARQPITITYDSRTDSTAVVVSEQKASGNRIARTWTRFAPSGAHITKVYVRMEYSGFRFERTYVPEPPVEALRFPMKQGESWSGRWDASTSGSYRVKVGRARQIQVGNRSVTAYAIETTTEFHGDFEGKSRITAYIDPDTKAIVASEGVLNVTSQFGRYSTVFDTNIAGGPGY